MAAIFLYAHSVEVEIGLADPAKSIGGRREQWLANSGALLRRGLDLALNSGWPMSIRVVAGSENVAGSKSPNLGGRLLLFKPGADGIVTLEDGNNLYYNYSIESQRCKGGFAILDSNDRRRPRA